MDTAKTIRESFQKLHEKIKSGKDITEELEDEINELVYKLYGLNEEDIKVIEDFLKRF